MKRPVVQISILIIVALIIYIILQSGGSANSLPRGIGMEETYSKYQNIAFVLDVRIVEEWNKYSVTFNG